MAGQRKGEVQKPLKWGNVQETPVQFSNQVLVQHVQNEFVVSFGILTPLPFLQPPTKEEVESIKYVPVQTVCRVGMTPRRLLEVIKVLQTNYRTYQEGLTEGGED